MGVNFLFILFPNTTRAREVSGPLMHMPWRPMGVPFTGV